MIIMVWLAGWLVGFRVRLRTVSVSILETSSEGVRTWVLLDVLVGFGSCSGRKHTLTVS